MAYKFQLGAARLSGSLIQEGDITAASSDVTAVNGEFTTQVSAAAAQIPQDGLTYGGTAITATAAEMNYLDNDDLTSADIQKLADITADAAELNIMDGVTATTADINLLDGVTATTVELNYVDVATAGQAEASKALVVDSSRDIANINSGSFAYITASGEIWSGGGFYGASIGLGDASGIVQINGGLDQTGGEIHLHSNVAGDALSLTSGILDVRVDDSTIEVNADVLRVPTSGITNLQLSGNIAADKLQLGDALWADAGVLKVSASIAGLGLELGVGEVLNVLVDDSSVEISGDSLQVKALGITNDMLAGSIANAKLANSTISGVALGGTLFSLDDSGANSGISMTSYNGSSAVSDLAINLASSDALVLTNGLDLKATIAGNRTFSGDVTINGTASIDGDLRVNGDLTYVNTTNLKVTDALVTFASGAVSFGTGRGFEIGDGSAAHGYFKTAQVDIDGDTFVDDIFESSLPISASAFAAGNVYATTFNGQLVGSFQESVKDWIQSDAGATLSLGVNKLKTQTASLSFNLPASPAEGDVIRFKANAVTNVTDYVQIIAPVGGAGAGIDGSGNTITLESPNAAITLIYYSAGNEWMIF